MLGDETSSGSSEVVFLNAWLFFFLFPHIFFVFKKFRWEKKMKTYCRMTISPSLDLSKSDIFIQMMFPITSNI